MIGQLLKLLGRLLLPFALLGVAITSFGLPATAAVPVIAAQALFYLFLLGLMVPSFLLAAIALIALEWQGVSLLWLASDSGWRSGGSTTGAGLGFGFFGGGFGATDHAFAVTYPR